MIERKPAAKPLLSMAFSGDDVLIGHIESRQECYPRVSAKISVQNVFYP
ncbi:MAG: hypothetical protein L6416_04025 [Candidatus Omnitrophica bacterium]|nr:hypothetical protein [Candidatus Omnitrophota bacterium]